MKAFFKIISAALCVALLFSACSGKNEPAAPNSLETASGEDGAPPADGGKAQGSLELPYNPADGLNPFFARSNENRLLFPLLYEPLYALDSSYNPVPVIAEDIAVNGAVATVKIKSNVSCRGSSGITAEDVVYSFNLAKASYLYSGELSAVQSATAVSGTTVDFTLEKADALTAARLTFPIVKAGTADSPAATPTGSGDWYFSEDRLISTSNAEKTVGLCRISTRESAFDAYKIGLSDFFFSDLSDCKYSGVSGSSQEIRLNNMVYIGMNSKNGALTKYIRSAVAAGLNCEEIALSAYEGHAAAAKLPFNPTAYFGRDIGSASLSGDAALANKIIDISGYTGISSGVKSNGAYSLGFTLLVNSNNRYRLAAAYAIADQLNALGFKITVEPLPPEEYGKRIEDGSFDMYLGEVKLDGSMDISQFFKEKTPFSAGVDLTERAATEYARYRGGELSAAQYYKIFAEFYPFVPVCFRTGYAVTSRDLTLKLDYSPYNLYYGI